MGAEGSGRFWRGDIASNSHARRIINVAACWIGGVAVIGTLLNLLRGGAFLPIVLFAIALIGPSAFMLRRKSLLAARSLLVITSGCAVLCILLAAYWAMKIPPLAAFMLLASALWAFAASASARASKAAAYLRAASRTATA
jgi:hypothetical protein